MKEIIIFVLLFVQSLNPMNNASHNDSIFSRLDLLMQESQKGNQESKKAIQALCLLYNNPNHAIKSKSKEILLAQGIIDSAGYLNSSVKDFIKMIRDIPNDE